jgi:hypothetical protein
MYKIQLLKMNSSSKSTMTREEERKARARIDQERHIAKVKKEKAWLAANPHIAAQQEREKEEQKKNRETLRMLKTMKDEEITTHQKKKKPSNVFAALMDSDTDEEQEEKRQLAHFESIYEDKDWRNDMAKLYTESPDVTLSNPEIPAADNVTPEKKKFIWADECDE